jgi:hypothetical protein
MTKVIKINRNDLAQNGSGHLSDKIYSCVHILYPAPSLAYRPATLWYQNNKPLREQQCWGVAIFRYLFFKLPKMLCSLTFRG